MLPVFLPSSHQIQDRWFLPTRGLRGLFLFGWTGCPSLCRVVVLQIDISFNHKYLVYILFFL